MSREQILTVLRNKFSTNMFDASQPISLPQRLQSVEPVNKSLAQRAGQGISDFLSETGIISNPSRAFEAGQTLSSIGEFLPGIGDVAAGDEFGKALAEGDKLGIGLGALSAIPVVGKSIKKGAESFGGVTSSATEKLKTWYHGTNNYFDEFESSFLGSSNPAKDSKLGFYFSKTEDTANAYRDVTPSIKPGKFKKEYGRTIEEQKERIDKALPKFKSMFGIDFDEYKNLGVREQRKLNESVDNIEAGAKQITSAKRTLNPYTYEDHPFIMDEWIDETKRGRLIEANIPDSDLMEFDYDGQAWDENKQHAIAKEAQEQGFKGVLFKNMQDSGWFGGQGADDVALIFNPKDIKQIKRNKAN